MVPGLKRVASRHSSRLAQSTRPTPIVEPSNSLGDDYIEFLSQPTSTALNEPPSQPTSTAPNEPLSRPTFLAPSRSNIQPDDTAPNDPSAQDSTVRGRVMVLLVVLG